jgi:hypothetical protein
LGGGDTLEPEPGPTEDQQDDETPVGEELIWQKGWFIAVLVIVSALVVALITGGLVYMFKRGSDVSSVSPPIPDTVESRIVKRIQHIDFSNKDVKLSKEQIDSLAELMRRIILKMPPRDAYYFVMGQITSEANRTTNLPYLSEFATKLGYNSWSAAYSDYFSNVQASALGKNELARLEHLAPHLPEYCADAFLSFFGSFGFSLCRAVNYWYRTYVPVSIGEDGTLSKQQALSEAIIPILDADPPMDKELLLSAFCEIS